MKFILSDDPETAVLAITRRLAEALEHKKPTLWLVPGGSNIRAVVEVMRTLHDAATENLTVMLTDERYGPFDHADSNLRQLADNGFMPKKSRLIPVLQPETSLEQATGNYKKALEEALQQSELVVGHFGMGADGHIAGILPKSEASASNDFVCAYHTPEYTRITITARAIKHVHAAYLLAFGASKLPALENLRDTTMSYADQPAQIIKELPEAYVYNDQIGEIE